MCYFNDADGVLWQYSGGSGAFTLPVTYDSRCPGRASHETRLGKVIGRAAPYLISGGLLLWLGAWPAFGQFW
ncbi:hypothetical protein [Streptomyces sp. NPDC058664]|uniref:hypothetical protein n=1 Tax=Streptomyces sp. NPDC058664 TaxID=3346585 RepID=UPI0036537E5C